MTTKELSKIFAIALCIALVMGACSAPPAPPATPEPQNIFNALPPPPYGEHQTVLKYDASVDLASQTFQLISPEIEVKYGKTTSGVGEVEFETVKIGDLSGTSLTSKYGDFFKGKVSVGQYFGANGKLCGGIVELKVDSLSVLQIFTRSGPYPINRSKLSLLYSNYCKGGKPKLVKVIYNERWGATSADILAMGSTATWTNVKGVLSPEYQEWGFWTKGTAFEVVTKALEQAMSNLSSSAYKTPQVLTIDRDSAVELIGRQTGFVIERNGIPWGTIELDYDNLFGAAPNSTSPIANGALSRITWRIGGKYYALLQLTPRINPVPSTLWVFVDDENTADILKNQQWVNLYDPLDNNDIPHVLLAIHGIGDLKKINTSAPVSVKGSVDGKSVDASGQVTLDLGVTGGIAYTTLGNPSWEKIRFSRELLTLMGESGIEAVGLYFPTQPGNGSGLDYYLSVISLITAPKDLRLNTWDMDAGFIDRKGILSPEILDNPPK